MARLLLVLLLAALPLRAQELTVSAAQQQLAQDVAELVQQYRADLKWRLGIVKFDLADLEQQLEEELLDAAGLAQGLVDAWEGFFQTQFGYGYWTQQDVEAAAMAALDALADPPVALPSGFGVGDGGTLDRARSRMQLTLDRVLRKARKLQGKFAAKLLVQHGLAVHAVLDAAPPPPIAPNYGGSAIPLSPFPFHVEVLVAVSEPGVDGDGELCLAGTGIGDGPPTLDLTLLHPSGNTALPGQGISDGRFNVALPGPLDEGSYKLLLTQGGLNFSASITVP